VLTVRGGAPDSFGWPASDRFEYASWGDVSTLVRHPNDAGVWLGAVGVLDSLPDDIDAVVSLCRVGARQVPDRVGDHVEVWLIDSDLAEANVNLDLVLADAAAAVAALRAEGRTVLLHCVQAQSRTPIVAALYSALHLDATPHDAFADVIAALPAAHPNSAFLAAYARLTDRNRP
jgi:hypothetical protein